jgi:hypothetical protein
MKPSPHTAKLEDFGVRGTIDALHRKAEYAKQCKSLRQEQQVAFWLEIMRKDPEVAKLVTFKRVK